MNIASERLDLIPLTPAFLRASLAADTVRAESLLGSTLPAEWFAETGLMRLRLEQLEQDSALQALAGAGHGTARQRAVLGRLMRLKTTLWLCLALAFARRHIQLSRVSLSRKVNSVFVPFRGPSIEMRFKFNDSSNKFVPIAEHTNGSRS